MMWFYGFIYHRTYLETQCPVNGWITEMVNAQRYLTLLRETVVPCLIQRGQIANVTFMQDGATSHTANPVKAFLIQTFGEDRIVSRRCRYPWPPRSPDLAPADFWLWGYLKSRVYLSGPSSLSELKDAIRREVSSIHPDVLPSTIAGFVTRLECLLPCGGGHVVRQTAGEIARHTTQATGRPISRFTVARRLHGGGLFARRPVRCVSLTPAHRRRRSLWCREHRNWRDNEWGRVLFTDESRFSLSSDSHRILIWRERERRYHPSNIIERDMYGGRGVLVWGGIMLGSRTDLHIFDAGSVNGTRYLCFNSYIVTTIETNLSRRQKPIIN
ncbi:DUF4817 domain-containing protein [Trichonephila clavipes]|nr:DUF4817 domain-containing protein [Trichonephila clavipes]